MFGGKQDQITKFVEEALYFPTDIETTQLDISYTNKVY